jgi:hypothetical protein
MNTNALEGLWSWFPSSRPRAAGLVGRPVDRPRPGMTSFLDFLTAAEAGTRGFHEVLRTPAFRGNDGIA